MRNDKTIQIALGIGIGLLVFGLAVFAQRGSEVFSFEGFRAPPFSLRNPSTEDRPLVEVVSSEPTDSANGVGQEAETPLTSVPLRLHPELSPRPLIGEGAQRFPSRLSSEQFRGAVWQMPVWTSYDRDYKELAIRPEESDTLMPQEMAASGSSKEHFLKNEDLPPQSYATLSFSDTSLNFLGLREADRYFFIPTKPKPLTSVYQREGLSSNPLIAADPKEEAKALVFRESALGIRGDSLAQASAAENRSPREGGSELLVNLNGDEKPGKFKDYTQKTGDDSVSTDPSKEKQELAKSREGNPPEEDPGAILAKKNEEAREIERRPQEDRRFTAVEENTNLYDNDGARFYAPGMKLGQFDVRLDLQNQVSYIDNYRSASKSKKKEAATTVNSSPALEMASGERDPEITDALYMAFRYSPTLINFIDVDQKEIINHSLAFNAGYRFSKLALIVDQRILPYSGGDIESGNFITRNFYITSVSAEYEVSDKTSLEVGLGNSIRDYKDGFDSQDTSLRAFANYSWSEKIRLGLGGSYGRATSQGGPDQDYQQALVRAVYFPTPKTTLFAESGLESRQFERFSKDQNSFVFKSGGNLALFPKTTLSVNASRTQVPSAVTAGENVSATGVNASVSQALYQFTLGGGLGYESVSFIKTTNNSKNLADEQYYSLNLSGAYSLTDWWDLGLNYTHRITDKKKGLLGENNDIESNQTTFSSRVKF